MKKVICSLLILLMLLSMLPMTVSAETPVEPNYVVTSSQYFTDVDSGKAYYTAANYLYEQGIMAGVSKPYASGKVDFGGERALTRAELVIMLWRLDGSHEVTFYGQFPFSDCSYSSTVLSAVKWAVKNNIVGGTDDTHFKPKQEVTHQDALLILFRFIDYCGYSINTEEYYSDLYSKLPLKGFAGYAKCAAAWAYKNNILTKNDLDVSGFGAKKTCTRGFIAQYLYRMIRRYQDKYALIVINMKNLDNAGSAALAMKKIFAHYGANNIVAKRDITKAEFGSAMNSAFGNAKPLDICYIYTGCHGRKSNGLQVLFTDGLLEINQLKTEIGAHKGTFVVFLDSCYSGTYKAIAQTETEKSKIKLLCSAKASQVSVDDYWGVISICVTYWCKGSGLDVNTNQFGSMVADQYGTVGNKNGRISLRELYHYSYDKVCAATDNSQEIDCSNTSDKFNIFYTSLPNG